MNDGWMNGWMNGWMGLDSTYVQRKISGSFGWVVHCLIRLCPSHHPPTGVKITAH